jgi:molecular chaperone GrpE
MVSKDRNKIDASGQAFAKDSTSGPQAGPPDRIPGGESVQAEATMEQPGNENPTEATEVVVGEVVTPAEPGAGQPGGTAEAAAVPAGTGPDAPGLGAELEALRSELDERVKDLQRVTAEYANYRKRVDRDRNAVVEQSTGLVISALLPILDDLDRARDHDDLVGPFAAVAEQLNAALAKFGLTGFGEVGDSFDPTRHEAVTHQTSAEVTEPTCVAVMRRGYLLGDRLLRAALVAVADPE